MHINLKVKYICVQNSIILKLISLKDVPFHKDGNKTKLNNEKRITKL